MLNLSRIEEDGWSDDGILGVEKVGGKVIAGKTNIVFMLATAALRYSDSIAQ